MSIDENKAVVHRYFEEFHNQRRTDIGPDITPDDESAKSLVRLVAMMQTAFPDYVVTIRHMVAEGDAVATVWSGRGTHQGDWISPLGTIPATGKTIAWTGTTTLRLDNGKIVETLGSNWDHLGILQQMEMLPVSVPRAGA